MFDAGRTNTNIILGVILTCLNTSRWRLSTGGHLRKSRLSFI